MWTHPSQKHSPYRSATPKHPVSGAHVAVCHSVVCENPRCPWVSTHGVKLQLSNSFRRKRPAEVKHQAVNQDQSVATGDFICSQCESISEQCQVVDNPCPGQLRMDVLKVSHSTPPEAAAVDMECSDKSTTSNRSSANSICTAGMQGPVKAMLQPCNRVVVVTFSGKHTCKVGDVTTYDPDLFSEHARADPFRSVSHVVADMAEQMLLGALLSPTESEVANKMQEVCTALEVVSHKRKAKASLHKLRDGLDPHGEGFSAVQKDIAILNKHLGIVIEHPPLDVVDPDMLADEDLFWVIFSSDGPESQQALLTALMPGGHLHTQVGGCM